MVGDQRQAEDRTEHRAEQSSHAIYGLIIITATLVADRERAENAITALLALWGACFVLVLAHVYSSAVAELGQRGRALTYAEIHVVIADNIPVLAAVVIPSILVLAAAVGFLSLRAAVDASILTSTIALFVLGSYQARRQGASVRVQMSIGALGAILGVVVILAEVLLTR